MATILTTTHVSDDITVLTESKRGIYITSKDAPEMGCVIVAPAELPALLAALEKAAEEMGVETGQAKLERACKGLLEYRCHNALNFQLEKADGFMHEIAAAMPAEDK